MRLHKLHILLLFFLILNCPKGFSQVLYGTVIDESYEILVDAHIIDTVHNSRTISDDYGNFHISAEVGSVLKISYVGYKTKYINISSFSDTLREYVILKPNSDKLEEVIVTSSRIKTVVDERGTNVLDYIPYKEFTLVLKSYKSEKFISLEGLDTTFQEYLLDGIKAKSLFEDCYGNIHLLSKDSSYQIWMDSTLHIIDVSSISKFEKFLTPCIGSFNETNTFYTFSNHKKKYTLTNINKENLTKTHFFHVWDKEAEKVASYEYWAIIRYYHSHASEEQNLITNGVWNGNLIALQLPGDYVLNRMISWYLKIRGKEIKVKSLQTNNQIITVDYLYDSIYIFNDKGFEIHQVEFNAPLEKIVEIKLDKMTHDCYALCIHQGIYTLFSIDIISGETKNVFRLDEIAFAKNIQVFNNWVYLIKEQSGFHKLYRIKLSTTRS